MSQSHATYSWAEIDRRFQQGWRSGGSAMRELVQRLAQSRYAAALHPDVSLDALLLFQHERWNRDDPRVEIRHDGSEYIVRYQTSTYQKPLSSGTIESDWEKRSTDGLTALERCLDHLKWVVLESTEATRPAV